MTFQPLIYFAVLTKSNNCEPIFATIDSDNNNFYTICGFESIPSDYVDLDIVWYDFERCSFFRYSLPLTYEGEISCIFVMIMTNGAICTWLCYGEQTLTFSEFHCKEISVDIKNEEWNNVRISTQKKYDACRHNLYSEAGDFYKSSYSIFKRYAFRFLPIVYGNHEIDMRTIKENLKDGAVLKLDEDKIFEYQDAAVPQRISFDFLMVTDEYQGYFWFDDYSLVELFSKFYGSHPETKTDFIIRIDAENKKYELALYRQGLKEPVVIPESAYQLIVFKNKFEDYRSENYNQPRGAWIW